MNKRKAYNKGAESGLKVAQKVIEQEVEAMNYLKSKVDRIGEGQDRMKSAVNRLIEDADENAIINIFGVCNEFKPCDLKDHEKKILLNILATLSLAEGLTEKQRKYYDNLRHHLNVQGYAPIQNYDFRNIESLESVSSIKTIAKAVRIFLYLQDCNMDGIYRHEDDLFSHFELRSFDEIDALIELLAYLFGENGLIEIYGDFNESDEYNQDDSGHLNVYKADDPSGRLDTVMCEQSFDTYVQLKEIVFEYFDKIESSQDKQIICSRSRDDMCAAMGAYLPDVTPESMIAMATRTLDGKLPPNLLTEHLLFTTHSVYYINRLKNITEVDYRKISKIELMDRKNLLEIECLDGENKKVFSDKAGIVGELLRRIKNLPLNSFSETDRIIPIGELPLSLQIKCGILAKSALCSDNIKECEVLYYIMANNLNSTAIPEIMNATAIPLGEIKTAVQKLLCDSKPEMQESLVLCLIAGIADTYYIGRRNSDVKTGVEFLAYINAMSDAAGFGNDIVSAYIEAAKETQKFISGKVTAREAKKMVTTFATSTAAGASAATGTAFIIGTMAGGPYITGTTLGAGLYVLGAGTLGAVAVGVGIPALLIKTLKDSNKVRELRKQTIIRIINNYKKASEISKLSVDDKNHLGAQKFSYAKLLENV